MPLPLLFIAGSIVAAAAGVGAGGYGTYKQHQASELAKSAEDRYRRTVGRYERQQTLTVRAMDTLGSCELQVIRSFSRFSDLIEKIHNRPQFATLRIGGVQLPQYTPGQLKEAASGADVILGSLAGAAAGIAGGIAATGAISTTVAAFATAGTGTAISSLSGAAATNAVLAVLGGGTVAAGGGGVALGTLALGGAGLGIGVMIGGFVLAASGSRQLEKAEAAMAEVEKVEGIIDRLCDYLATLERTATDYYSTLRQVMQLYNRLFGRLTAVIAFRKDWTAFTPAEKQLTENLVKVVTVLYGMCKVNLVIQTKDPNGINRVNAFAVSQSQNTAKTMLRQMQLQNSQRILSGQMQSRNIQRALTGQIQGQSSGRAVTGQTLGQSRQRALTGQTQNSGRTLTGMRQRQGR